jgi:hypothetical protein
MNRQPMIPTAMNEPTTTDRTATDRTCIGFPVSLFWSLAAGTFLWWLLILAVERLVLA